jgi:hypothetical protein
MCFDISSFKKICPVGTELFQTDEQMDGHTERRKEDNSRFSQFFESS